MDSEKRAEMLKPIMDDEGNFYMFPSAIQGGSDDDLEKIKFDSYYYYDSYSKKIIEQKMPFNKFRNGEKPYNINDLKINDNGSIFAGGFYELQNEGDFFSHYFESNVGGVYFAIINKTSITRFNYLPLKNDVFPTIHSAQDKKTKDFGVFYDLHLLNNYAVVTKKMVGITYENYKPNRPGDESYEGYEDNAVFKISDGNLQYFTTYESKIFNNGYPDAALRIYKQIHFVEKNNKIYSSFTASNERDNLKILNKKNKKDWACVLNIFDQSTKESQYKLLYDITKDEKQLPDHLLQLQSTDWILWQNNIIRGVPVKVIFDK